MGFGQYMSDKASYFFIEDSTGNHDIYVLLMLGRNVETQTTPLRTSGVYRGHHPSNVIDKS